MKRNRLTIILVIILAAVAVVLVMQNRKGTLRREVGAFAIDDTASVTKIFMADMQGNKILLKEEKPGHWSLNDSMKARKEGVELLLNTMQRLAVKAPVSKSAYNTVIKRLASTSVKVEIYQVVPRINLFDWIKLFPHEKRTMVYYVGTATPDNMGSFMLKEGSDTPFVVYIPGFKGYVSARFSAFVSDWRDHTIFAKSPPQIRSIRVEFPQTPDESYLLEKNGDQDVKLEQLSTGKVFDHFDTTRVIDFINAYRNIRFETSFEDLTSMHRDSIMSLPPLNIISLTDTSGKTIKVKTYRRGNIAQQEDLEGNMLPYDVNRLYAWLEDDKNMVIIQYFVFDPITRPLSYLLGKDEKAK